MAMAVQDHAYDPVFIVFYSMVNGGWQRVKTFQVDDLGRASSVAMFGTTAFIGFGDAGEVVVYEKNNFEEWQKADDPFVQINDVGRDHFGRHN